MCNNEISPKVERLWETICSNIRRSVDAEVGLNEFISWYLVHGKVFVVEEMDIEKILSPQGIPGYSSCIGQLGGLHVLKRPLYKRIHIHVDSTEGVYGALDTQINPHYQIYIRDLRRFLQDIENLDMRVNVLSTCDSGSQTIVINTFSKADAIVYTPNHMRVVSRDESGGVQKNDGFGFFAHRLTRTMKEMVKMIGTESLVRFMLDSNKLDNTGAKDRNQTACINFGYCFLNCTDKSRSDIHNIPSPHLTKCYDNVRPWGHSFTDLEQFLNCVNADINTMSATLRLTMAWLTSLMDVVTEDLNLGELFNDPKRNKKFGFRIHPLNRFEMLTISICLKLLLCHGDIHNGKEKNYNVNFTCYKYVRDECVADAHDEYAWKRVHIGGYSRRICETRTKIATSVDRLIEDFDNWLPTIEKNRLIYDVNCLKVTSTDVWDSFNNVVFRKPHIDKFMFL